ncbi:MAG TPA: ribonuclease P protein component [Candidatus Sulfotelmatobacter sp.]|nr:ribonuclease P protein component [Candidatus Sulfotelmatobacter sp.]
MSAVAPMSDLEKEVRPERRGHRFPRAARLLRHADFEAVYKQGRRHFSPSMTVFYWLRSKTEPPRPAISNSNLQPRVGLRIGFTVGRALGGAVQRNRMKRRLREAVRLTRPRIGPNADVVINPKKSLLSADFQAVVKEVERAFALIEQKCRTEVSESTQRLSS